MDWGRVGRTTNRVRKDKTQSKTGHTYTIDNKSTERTTSQTCMCSDRQRRE